MKSLALLFLCSCVISANAKGVIKGKINVASGSIQLMVRNSPFDDNVNLLAESTIENGIFEFNFNLAGDTEILFQVEGFSTSKNILRESNWEVVLELQRLSKPDYFGNTKKLKIITVDSDNVIDYELFEIEKNIEKIKKNNRKGNGRLSKNYANELTEYLEEVIKEAESQSFISKLATSKTFAYALTSIKQEKKPSEFFEQVFAENFEFSFAGLEAVETIYARPIQMQFFTKKFGKTGYFEFTEESLSAIDDPQIRLATNALLITNAMGRKWTDQEKTKEELASFMQECENPELKSLLQSFHDLHQTSLIGTELTNFEIDGVDGTAINFNDYRGKYLLLDFWATWCGPCIKSMKKLPEVKLQHGELEILCITTEKDTEKVSRFINRNNYNGKLNFGIAFNEKEIDSYFNKRAIPLYFLVDPSGTIIGKAVADPIPMIDRHLNKVTGQ